MRKVLALVAMLATLTAVAVPMAMGTGYPTTTTKHEETTTSTKDDHTTTTKDDHTTTTKHDETTTSKHDTTTTTKHDTTTTEKETTTTEAPTTTEPPVVTPFCVDANTATAVELEQLDGVTALIALAIIAGRPYESVQDLADVVGPVAFLLILVANADTGAFVADTCLTPATVTTTTQPTTTTTEATTTTSEAETTTTTTPLTMPPSPPTTVPFVFGAAATVCVAEVPTIRITFQNTFPELAGQTGTLTMSDVNGNVVSTQSLAYEPGTTVDLLYPGTSVNADGSIDDVPGWILTDDGLWIRDPSDEFLREGINLSYTVNPTATAFITYPPESSECANPENPPITTTPGVTSPPSRFGELPLTGIDSRLLAWLAFIGLSLGGLFLVSAREDG